MEPVDQYPSPGRAPAAVARVRTPLVMLTTFLVELVVIAGAGNQFVVDRLSKQLKGPILKQGLLESLFTFYWRFSPKGGTDVGHFWLSRLLCVVAVLVLGPLLVGLVVRGPITFFRAFFSVLFAIVTATMLATFVRGLVADPRLYGYTDPRLAAAMFRPSGPDSPAFWGGLALGLVVALIVSIVAVATRRRPAVDDDGASPGPDQDTAYTVTPVREQAPLQEPGAMREPDAVPSGAPWQDRYYGPPPPVGATRPDDAPTQTVRLPDTSRPVQQQPAQQQPLIQQPPMQQSPRVSGEPQPVPDGQTATMPRVPDQPTARFPRPPDDEDFPEH